MNLSTEGHGSPFKSRWDFFSKAKNIEVESGESGDDSVQSVLLLESSQTDKQPKLQKILLSVNIIHKKKSDRNISCYILLFMSSCLQYDYAIQCACI